MRVPLLVALGFAAFYVGGAIVGERTVYVGDLTAFERPRDRFLARSLREGEGIPRWAPGIYGGAAALGAQEMALLYAPNTLVAAVAPDRACAIGIFLHLVVASLGAFALARALGVSEEGALLAAIVYGSGGAILSAHSVAVYVRSAAFLPWVLAGVARGSTWLTTLAILATYLGGDPFGCVIAAVASLAVRPSFTIVKAAGLAMLLGAAQLLPALGALGDSARTEGYSFEHAMKWSLWPPELAGLVVPSLFGSWGKPESIWWTAISPDPEQTRPWLPALYVGPTALALAAAGARKPSRARTGLLLLGFTFFAFGAFTPLGRVLYLVPSFRYPAKLFLPATLGIALLAARGLEELPRKGLMIGLGVLGGALIVALNLVVGELVDLGMARDPYVDVEKATAALVFGLAHGAIFAFGGVAILARARRKRLALLVLLGLDLAVALRPAILTAPRAIYDAPPAAAARLRELEDEERAPARLVVTGLARRPTPEEIERGKNERFHPGEPPQSLMPDVGMGDGVRSQHGFLSSEPLRPLALWYRTVQLGLSYERAGVLRGARYVYASAQEKLEGEHVCAFEGRVLLRLKNAPPWACVYPRVRFAQDLHEALGHLDEGVPTIEGSGPSSEGTPRPARLASRFGLHRFELDAEGPGWLVVHETFARGWTAAVDGEEATILPANGAFRAVLLGPGKKHVVFEYRAPGAIAGAAVSALAVLGCAAWVLRRRRA